VKCNTAKFCFCNFFDNPHYGAVIRFAHRFCISPLVSLHAYLLFSQ
jgi:hypothetical protein